MIVHFSSQQKFVVEKMKLRRKTSDIEFVAKSDRGGKPDLKRSGFFVMLGQSL